MAGKPPLKPPARPPGKPPAGATAPRPSSVSVTAPGLLKPQSAFGAPSTLSLPMDLGLTSERRRAHMVQHLRTQGIQDAAVLAAMGTVPRHAFVDEGLASRAYEDSALPIGHAQTISQPYIVARMIEWARGGQPLGKVLEVGTGCGYQAAVLARVAREVYSIERIKVLHELARANLRAFRLSNVRLVLGDGMQGLPEAAPFDAIVVAAAGLELPPALLAQLAVGGRLIAPVGPASATQRLVMVTRESPERTVRRELEAVRFVPLKPGVV
jgi:protein-L-isoaspartate(D-aspartate) O-methyltransferase